MKKIELIELVSDFLKGGDGPSEMKGRYHDQIISRHLGNAFNNIVFQVYMEAKNFADYSVLDAWAKDYSLSIADLSDGKGRVLLPFPPLQLPNNMGIVQVAPVGDITNAFAYWETNANAVFSALEVGQVSTRPRFYLERNINSPASEVESHVLKVDKVPDQCISLLVKMIVPIERLDDYEEVPIPAGKEDMLVKSIAEFLLNKPPKDLINDNNPSR